MKKWIGDHKREIIVGVVVWGITALLSFAGKWFLDVAPTIGNSIIDTLSNTAYTIAATTADDFLSTLILAGFVGILTGSGVSSILAGISTQRAVHRMEKDISDKSEEELKELEAQLSKELALPEQVRIKDTIRSGKKLKAPLIILILLIIFLHIFLFFFVLYPSSIKNKFDRDITMIYPYVEEATIHKLRSNWVCMRSKSDYDDLYLYIDQIQIDNSLPKQR